MPCYNVANRCGEILRQIASCADVVIAVNDGSADETETVLRSIAASHAGKIRVLSHQSNRGKGVALMAAFKLALAEVPFDVLVTIDADGQHDPADLPRLVDAYVAQQAALVIGERTPTESMPWRSRLGNGFTSVMFRLLYPACPRDTQSGLRAMDREFVARIVKTIKPRRYETELQILMLALDLEKPISTVPIRTIYFDRNRLSHFRPIKDSLRIYWAFLAWHLPVGRKSSEQA